MKQLQMMAAFLVLMLASASPFAQAGKILDRLLFEVIINVVWRGKEIEIRKVLSCDMRRRMYPKDRATSIHPGQNLELREVWDQGVRRIYHVLPSKEVLIFELPTVCNPLKKALSSLQESFLPIVYWVDSADSPKEAEEIVSYRYFTENPRHRFEVLKFQVTDAKYSAEKIDDDQHLVDLIHSRLVRYNAYFVGLSAMAFPKAVWAKYPGLASELSKYTESGNVDRNLVRQTAPPLLSICQSEAQGIGPSDQCLTGPLDTRPYVIPAAFEDGIWRLKYGEVGVRRYMRYVDFDKLDRSGCVPGIPHCNVGRETYRFEVDGKVYERSMSSTVGMFFDAQEQMLLRFGYGLVRSTFKQEIAK